MQYLLITQIIISVLLVICVAVQQRGAALGSAFGGGNEVYSSRRGTQKKIFYATIVLTVTFIVLGVVNLFI